MTNDTETQATVRQAERCGGQTRDGRPCGMIAVRPTPDGPRCAHHDPDRPQTRQDGPRRRRAPRPPVSALVTPADALALSSWAAIQSARGRLTKGQADAVLHACREWRHALRDSGVLAEFEALKQTVARLSAKGAP